jgi:soluble lytic murein transglycosylase
MAAPASETSAFAAALAAAQQGDWSGATIAAQGAGAVAADVIEWQRLRAGEGSLSDYEAFLARRPDWPGLPLLKGEGEAQLAGADAARILAYFGEGQPRTAAGVIALTGAYYATGQQAKADAEALRGWIQLPFTADEEAELLATHPEVEAKGNIPRLDKILWDGERTSEAKRMLPRVGPDWQALAAARLALRANADNASTYIKAVPVSLASDPGLAYDRFVWRMRRDLYPEATVLILQRSGSADSLGDPTAWTDRRLTLSRYLMRSGRETDAYRVASSHHIRPEDDNYNDLEFLAGFIALRKLDDPSRALVHFQNLPASGPAIVTSRRGYWLGRTYEAMGRKDPARAAYQDAAKGQSAYYGLLSAERLGLTLDASLLADAAPPAKLSAKLANSSVLDAAVRLAKADSEQLSGRFMVHLTETLTTAEMGQLAGYALSLGEYRSAILVAKAAAEQGVIFPGAYYPVPDVVPTKLAVSRALALAIARRESEFDPEATSAAGALGLMQLMPETAKAQAKELGLGYDRSKLTSDPGYNITLGSEYLAGLVDTFGPSVALIAVGYNAGPGRSSSWIKAFGDPRAGTEAAVDWVETIPFAETRTYVMRVAESVTIYRAKLKGQAGPVNISGELTGQ